MCESLCGMGLAHVQCTVGTWKSLIQSPSQQQSLLAPACGKSTPHLALGFDFF